MTAITCEGHVEVNHVSYTQLRQRYGHPIGFIAELAKKNAERKLMHEMLNDADVPVNNDQGQPLCLIARLAFALEAMREMSEDAWKYRDLQ